ncbi:MAG: hypothetical protein JSS20_20585, partial [Proteobacteria bacterium]|nr:hypothetical protein [Pseudomonadota bacterium]
MDIRMFFSRLVSFGLAVLVSVGAASAQSGDGPTCVADREKLDALLKAGDENLVRLFVGSLECPAVRDEGQRWLLNRQARTPEAGDTPQKARDLGQ